jgi:hypothetical protein
VVSCNNVRCAFKVFMGTYLCTVFAQVAARCKGNVQYRSISAQEQRGSGIKNWLAISDQKRRPVPGMGKIILDSPFHRPRLQGSQGIIHFSD